MHLLLLLLCTLTVCSAAQSSPALPFALDMCAHDAYQAHTEAAAEPKGAAHTRVFIPTASPPDAVAPLTSVMTYNILAEMCAAAPTPFPLHSRTSMLTSRT